MSLRKVDANCVSKLLDFPLSGSACQEMCFTGMGELYALRSTLEPEALALELPELSGAIPTGGLDACLPHTDTVSRVFAGVTTRTFQAIQSLYCDGVGRSLCMMCEILDRIAQRDGARPPHREAVMISCLNLQKRRRESVNVQVRCQVADWRVGCFSLPFRISSIGGRSFKPAVAYIADTAGDEVISFRVADSQGVDHALMLALYDAIVTLRRPSATSWDGLDWALPRNLLLLDREHSAAALGSVCRSLAISLELLPSSSFQQLPTVAEWERRWCSAIDPGQPPLPLDQFELRLDNTLYRLQGYGPKRRKVEIQRELTALVGYGRDPAQAFPAIRRLLPAYPSSVDNGAVEFDRLHYADELLELWPGQAVLVRQSVESEARAWVYLGDEILCEARAMELRRRDGTYRPHR